MVGGSYWGEVAPFPRKGCFSPSFRAGLSLGYGENLLVMGQSFSLCIRDICAGSHKLLSWLEKRFQLMHIGCHPRWYVTLLCFWECGRFWLLGVLPSSASGLILRHRSHVVVPWLCIAECQGPEWHVHLSPVFSWVRCRPFTEIAVLCGPAFPLVFPSCVHHK